MVRQLEVHPGKYILEFKLAYSDLYWLNIYHRMVLYLLLYMQFLTSKPLTISVIIRPQTALSTAQADTDYDKIGVYDKLLFAVSNATLYQTTT